MRSNMIHNAFKENYVYKIYWNNSDFADRTDLRFSRAVYFPLGNFSIMCAERAVRQRPSATFARLLEVARYTFSLSVRSSQLQYRIAQSGQGGRKEGIDAETGAGCFGVTRRPEDLLWRHSCRTNSIYCPRMPVIGRYWTFANEHGGWKVYWKVASVI